MSGIRSILGLAVLTLLTGALSAVGLSPASAVGTAVPGDPLSVS